MDDTPPRHSSESLALGGSVVRFFPGLRFGETPGPFWVFLQIFTCLGIFSHRVFRDELWIGHRRGLSGEFLVQSPIRSA